MILTAPKSKVKGLQLASSCSMPRKFKFTRRKNDERKKRAAHNPSATELGRSKRAKLDGSSEHSSNSDSGGDGSIFPFCKFRADRVLFTDPRSKSICVLGSCTGPEAEAEAEEKGIVLAEKQPLTESSLPHLFSSSVMEKKFQNDVYSQYVLNCKEGGLGEMRVTTVYPATDRHVQKYEAQKRRFVLETPENYHQITKPFAERQSLSLDVREIASMSHSVV